MHYIKRREKYDNPCEFTLEHICIDFLLMVNLLILQVLSSVADIGLETDVARLAEDLWVILKDLMSW